MSFTEYLQIPELAQRYRKVKKYFFLRESAYDVTSVCQLRCDGCYYFQGKKYQVKDNRDPQAWRVFFEAEKARGISYVVLAGAEPALVPKIIRACYGGIPLGSVPPRGARYRSYRHRPAGGRVRRAALYSPEGHYGYPARAARLD